MAIRISASSMRRRTRTALSQASGLAASAAASGVTWRSARPRRPAQKPLQARGGIGLRAMAGMVEERFIGGE